MRHGTRCSGHASTAPQRGALATGAVLLALVLAGLPVSRADASHLRLSWDACGDAGIPHKSFACDGDSETDTLVISFVATQSFPKIANLKVFMFVCFSDFALPDWWRVLGSDGCRLGALTVTAARPAAGCAEIWDPVGGSIQEIIPISGTVVNGFRFAVSVSVGDSTRARDIIVGQEFELARLVLDHTRTAGPDSCQGCTIGANIGADFIWFFSTQGNNWGVSTAPSVTWQDSRLACRAFTPVTRRTWGAIKSMYR